MDLLRELAYTRSQLLAYPIAAPFVPGIDGLITEWRPILDREIGFLMSEMDGLAWVFRVDEDIDPLVQELAARILVEVHNNRRDLLYQRYFGRSRPSDLIRPVLGPELEEVRTWPPSLKVAPQEQLRPIGVQMEELVTEADGALKAQTTTTTERADFEKVGPRRVFIDKVNTFRGKLYADLSALPNTPEGKALSLDFADRFFLSPKPMKKRRNKQAPTLDELRTRISDLQALAEEIEREQRAQAEAETQRLTDEAEAKALEARLKELRLKLGN
jgi:hypothetical protein